MLVLTARKADIDSASIHFTETKCLRNFQSGEDQGFTLAHAKCQIFGLQPIFRTVGGVNVGITILKRQF